MPASHAATAGGYLDYTAVSPLLPVASLPGGVRQFRDAQRRLGDVETDRVLAVTPTGLASGYALAQHPLTSIEIEALPPDICTALGVAAAVELADYTVIQISGTPTEYQNHSLAEF